MQWVPGILIVKPWSKSKPLSQQTTPKFNKSSKIRKKGGFGPRADTKKLTRWTVRTRMFAGTFCKYALMLLQQQFLFGTFDFHLALPALNQTWPK